eukprot:Rhum_TRINITY_DN14518_c25_g1::Rhum_TRINITY_DN14518_c25_g1_i1::g.96286::m.96286
MVVVDHIDQIVACGREPIPPEVIGLDLGLLQNGVVAFVAAVREFLLFARRLGQIVQKQRLVSQHAADEQLALPQLLRDTRQQRAVLEAVLCLVPQTLLHLRVADVLRLRDLLQVLVHTRYLRAADERPGGHVVVDNLLRHPFLRHTGVVYLRLGRALRHKSVDDTRACLPVPVEAEHGLLVRRRVERHVEQHGLRRRVQVDAHPTRLQRDEVDGKHVLDCLEVGDALPPLLVRGGPGQGEGVAVPRDLAHDVLQHGERRRVLREDKDLFPVLDAVLHDVQQRHHLWRRSSLARGVRSFVEQTVGPLVVDGGFFVDVLVGLLLLLLQEAVDQVRVCRELRGQRDEGQEVAVADALCALAHSALPQPRVYLLLLCGQWEEHHVLGLRGKVRHQDALVPPVHKRLELLIEDVCPLLHQLRLPLRRRRLLPRHDGPLEVLDEALPREVVGTDEVDHRPVLGEVVLQRRASQHEATGRAEVGHGHGQRRLVVPQQVSLVCDHQVDARVLQDRLHPVVRLRARASPVRVDEDAVAVVRHQQHAGALALRPVAHLDHGRVPPAQQRVQVHLSRHELAPPLELVLPVAQRALRCKDDRRLDDPHLQHQVHLDHRLRRLPQAHRVRQHAPCSVPAVLRKTLRLHHQVPPHEPKPVDLMRLQHVSQSLRQRRRTLPLARPQVHDGPTPRLVQGAQARVACGLELGGERRHLRAQAVALEGRPCVLLRKPRHTPPHA